MSEDGQAPLTHSEFKSDASRIDQLEQRIADTEAGFLQVVSLLESLTALLEDWRLNR